MANMSYNIVLEDDAVQWATFRLGRELYGVQVTQVMEIIRYIEVTPVPGAPESVIGIVNIRGNVVTVIDTCERLSLGAASVTDQSHIVIVEADGLQAGLLVDNVDEVIYLNPQDIEVPPHVTTEEASQHISNVCKTNSGLLIMINLKSFLDFSKSWHDYF